MKKILMLAFLSATTTANAQQDYGTAVGHVSELGSSLDPIAESGAAKREALTPAIEQSGGHFLGGTTADIQNPGVKLPKVARSFASADLRFGELKASSNTTSGGTRASASASLVETLTFTGNVGALSEITPIIIQATYHGIFNRGSGSASLFSQYGFTVEHPIAFNRVATATFSEYREDTPLGTDFFSFGQAGWTYFDRDVRDNKTIVSATVNLLGGNPTLRLTNRLQTFSSGDGASIFENTASLNVITPDGVSFTSASGAFLSAESPGAVPEPITWSLMLVGLFATGAALRRERTVRSKRATILG